LIPLSFGGVFTSKFPMQVFIPTPFITHDVSPFTFLPPQILYFPPSVGCAGLVLLNLVPLSVGSLRGPPFWTLIPLQCTGGQYIVRERPVTVARLFALELLVPTGLVPHTVLPHERYRDDGGGPPHFPGRGHSRCFLPPGTRRCRLLSRPPFQSLDVLVFCGGGFLPQLRDQFYSSQRHLVFDGAEGTSCSRAVAATHYCFCSESYSIECPDHSAFFVFWTSFASM